MEMLHCTIDGRVQGVGFRYSALSAARSLGLAGWVRNLPNGSVETRAWGSPEQIADYLSWLRSGPSFARVEQVSVIQREEVDSAPGTGFTIK